MGANFPYTFGSHSEPYIFGWRAAGSSEPTVSYLLDDPSITAGLAAITAPFRLKTGYLGPIYNVRRTVGATTTIVSIGLGTGNYVSLDNPVLSVIVGSSAAANLGQFVAASGFADVDGLGSPQSAFTSAGYSQETGLAVWTQVSATSQARIVLNGVVNLRNGVPELYFDGINDWCDFGLLGGATKPANWSVIGVGAFDVATNFRTFCGSADPASNASARTWGSISRRAGADVNRIEWSYGDSPPDLLTNVRYGVTSANVITTGQQMLMEWHKQFGTINGNIYTDGTARALRVDGGTGVNTGGTNYPFVAGRFNSLLSAYLQGGVQFLGVWTAYKDADRVGIKTKLNEMLGTTW